MRHPDAKRIAHLLAQFEVSVMDCEAALNELIDEMELMRHYGHRNPDVGKILTQSSQALRQVALYLGLRLDD